MDFSSRLASSVPMCQSTPPLGVVEVVRPGGDLFAQRLDVADAAMLQALPRHAAQLAFRHVQPAAVFRRVAELDARAGSNASWKAPMVCVLRLSQTRVTRSQSA